MSTLRRRIAAVAMLLLVPTLAACGFNEQTDAIYQASTGTNSRDGQVWILNATVVSAKDGAGTFAGTLVNQSQTDTITLVSVSDAVGAPKVSVGPGSHVNLATSGAIRLENGGIVAGKFVDMTFQFDNGDTTTFKVPVVTHTGDYHHVPVGPAATSSGTATKAHEADGDKTADASTSD